MWWEIDRSRSRAEPNNSPDKAGAITINTVINGEINGGADVDCFSLEGKRGQRLFLDLKAERIESRLDATIRILTPAGTELAESRDVFRSRPVSGCDAAGRRPLRDQGARRDLRRVTRPFLSLDGSRRPTSGRDSARGDRARLARELDADRPRAGCRRHSSSRRSRPRAACSSDWLFPTPFETRPCWLHEPHRAGAKFRSARRPWRLRRGVDFSHVRDKPVRSKLPVVSNSMFVGTASDPVVLEQEPNDDEAHAQLVRPPCDITGTFAPRGDNDLFRFEGKKGEIWWVEALAERIGSMADPAFLIQKVGAKGQPPQDLVSGDDLPDAGAGPQIQHADGRRGRALAGARGRALPGLDLGSLCVAARTSAIDLPPADSPRAAGLFRGAAAEQSRRRRCGDGPRRRANVGVCGGDPQRRFCRTDPRRAASFAAGRAGCPGDDRGRSGDRADRLRSGRRRQNRRWESPPSPG